MQEVYDLLHNSHVSDPNEILRFDHKIEFLRYYLDHPDQEKQWIVGIRGGKKNKLFGFFACIPLTLSVKVGETI